MWRAAVFCTQVCARGSASIYAERTPRFGKIHNAFRTYPCAVLACRHALAPNQRGIAVQPLQGPARPIVEADDLCLEHGPLADRLRYQRRGGLRAARRNGCKSKAQSQDPWTQARNKGVPCPLPGRAKACLLGHAGLRRKWAG